MTRALAFPATVTPEDAKPYLATFEPYTRSAFSGLVLPDAEELDDREIAEQVFRAGTGRQRSAASRAADLRAAQVKRSEPEAPLRAPERIEPGAAPSEVAAASPRSAAGRAGSCVPPHGVAAPIAGRARLRDAGRVARLRHHRRARWGLRGACARARVLGSRAAVATPEVTRAIAKARADAPARGTTVVIVDVGAATVVMTDAAPTGDTHSAPAGERRAWIAGVAKPNAFQRAALAAAIEADARAQ